MTQTRQRWCVIGGGLLGLALAHRLTQEGQSVCVYEAAPELGGLASAWQLGDVLWDRHYHVIMLSDSHLRDLLAEMDMDREIRWCETKTGFYTGDGFYQLSSVLDYLRFPALNLIDKVRLAGTIVYMSRIKNGKPLEEKPLAPWLRRLSGKRVFEKIWRPLLSAKMGTNYEKASASFIWAYATRFYAARKGGMKKEMFGYVPGGYARILDGLAKLLTGQGASIRLGAPVTRIVRENDGLRVETPQGTERFDQVVVTAASPLAARICNDVTAEERAKLEGVLYQGIICPSLLLKKPLGGYYLTYITDSNMPFTTVIEMSALVDRDESFGSHSLVYLPRYATAEDPFWKCTDEEIEERFLKGLFTMYPQLTKDDVVSFRVSRVRQVYAVTTVGYSRTMPSIVTSVPGLYTVSTANIVNASLAVNESIALAKTVLPELLAAAEKSMPVAERKEVAA